MKLEIKDASPDGMTIVYETFLMTWDDLKDFIDVVSAVEANKMKELLGAKKDD